MKCVLTILLAIGALAVPAQAHFIWLIPDDPYSDKPGARVVFSESPEPDSADLMKKVMQTKVFVRGADGKSVPVKYQLKDAAFVTELTGEGMRVVEAVCEYGVFQRGESEPMLLRYYARTFVGQGPINVAIVTPSKHLQLEALPGKKANHFQVLWQGKPLAGAEVRLMPANAKASLVTSDKDGLIKIPESKNAGLHALRIQHVEKKAGAFKGKSYKEIRCYFTLTVLPVRAKSTKAAQKAPAKVENEKERKAENPAATKLLSEARKARAEWHGFTGFTADLSVNVDGKITRGKVTVSGEGNVKLSGFDDDPSSGAVLSQLRSVVGHRLPSERTSATPCAFPDDNAHHPLGRRVQVLNDEFHSSYRIRDKQIIIVNRSMPGARFTITVLKNYVTKEKTFLPAHYVVNYWDLKSDALKQSNSFYYTWKRVGAFDLPATAMVVTASADGKLTSRTLTLKRHKLLKSAAK